MKDEKLGGTLEYSTGINGSSTSEGGVLSCHICPGSWDYMSSHTHAHTYLYARS